jgi:RNA polymerase sigma-70 factor (ECF subfamily)
VQALGVCLDAAVVVIYRQAHWLWQGHASNAEDLTQDVLEGLNKLAVDGKLCITGNVEAFLRKTTKNRFIDQHRRRRLSTTGLEQSHQPVDVDPGPDELVIAAEDARMLHEAIEKLPKERHRIIVRLKLKGFSLSEIAELLDDAKSTVHGQQTAAFRQLRNIIRRAGWEQGS